MASIVFIDKIIEHLERVVREETEALNRNAGVDLRDHNLRKSQGLYTLTRALRRPDSQSLNPATLAKLQDLRMALEANRISLSRHLEAVREIANLLSDVIRKSESDGTYDIPSSNGGCRE